MNPLLTQIIHHNLASNKLNTASSFVRRMVKFYVNPFLQLEQIIFVQTKCHRINLPVVFAKSDQKTGHYNVCVKIGIDFISQCSFIIYGHGENHHTPKNIWRCNLPQMISNSTVYTIGQLIYIMCFQIAYTGSAFCPGIMI